MNRNLEIHSLRGLSIIAVFLYHFNPNIFSGGYLGVDIFFVISGFLISKMIFVKKKINLKKFLENRVRRIVPAYFFILFLFFPIFIFLLSPEILITYIKSNISSLLFLSNIFYLGELNYYNPPFRFNNLLHTWSLSVEMQFYLFFALIIFFCVKVFKKINVIDLVILTIFSFFFSILCYYKYFNFNFFYLLPRLYQFLLGSIVFFVIYKKEYFTNINSKKTSFLIFSYYIAIIILVLSPMIMKHNYNFAYLNNIIICICASTIIFVSEKLKNKYYSLINNRLFIFFGTISYSLYLIHFPTIHILRELEIYNFLITIFISIFFSYLVYFFIEKNNFIKKIKFKFFLKLLFIFLLLFISLNLYIFKFSNLNYFHKYNKIELENLKIIKNARENIGYEILESKCKFLIVNQNPELKNRIAQCKNKYKYSILLIGDSHAIDIHNGFAQNDENFFLATIADEGCRVTSNCKKITNVNKFLLKNKNVFDVIIYHQTSSDYTNNQFLIEDEIYKILDYLSKINHHKIIWLGDRPHFNIDLNSRYFIKNLKQALNEIYKNYKINLSNENKIKIFSQKKEKINYLSLKKMFNDLNTNYLFINNNVTYSDSTHFSQYGEKFFVDKLMSEIK